MKAGTLQALNLEKKSRGLIKFAKVFISKEFRRPTACQNVVHRDEQVLVTHSLPRLSDRERRYKQGLNQ